MEAFKAGVITLIQLEISGAGTTVARCLRMGPEGVVN
jgi:hypothetical protein